MTSRFYQETPCEHGIYDDTQDIIEQEHFQDCPGGSRTELHPATPKIAAATKVIDDMANAAGYSWNPNIGPVVDAALAGVVLLQEP